MVVQSISEFLHGSDGGGASAGPDLGDGLLVEVSPLLGVAEVGLGLAELGQVEGGDLLGLLDLLLVRPDPALQLVDQVLHALVVLPVLVGGEGQLLDAALRPAQVLLGVGETAVLSVQLRGQLPDAGLHLVHGLLASLQGIGLGLIQAGLHVLDLALVQLLVLLVRHGNLLFLAELISKASSINHCILSLLICQLCLMSHFVHLAVQGLHLRLQLPLGSSDGLVLAGLVRELLISVGQFLLSLASSPVSLLKKGLGLLKGISNRVCLPVSGNEGIPCNVLCPLLILKLGLGLANGLVVPLDGPLALGIGSISVLQGSLQLNNISLKLLLHPQSLGLALGLHLQSALHTIKILHVVLPGHFKLLLLLCNAALNLLLDLSQLELSPQHLVLLLLQGSLCLLKGGLELHLLSLQALPDLVNLVDGPATLADLVHDVLDLIAEKLVLLANLVKLKSGFFVGILDAEQLRRSIPALLLGNIQIHAETISLGLPLTNNLLELPGLLLHGIVQKVGLVSLSRNFINFDLELIPGPLKLTKLGLHLLNGALSLSKPGLHLHLCHLQFLSLGQSFTLILDPPHVSFLETLVQQPERIVLGRGLILHLLPHSVQLMLQIPVASHQGLPLLCLIIAHPLGLIKLGSQLNLELGEHIG